MYCDNVLDHHWLQTPKRGQLILDKRIGILEEKEKIINCLFYLKDIYYIFFLIFILKPIITKKHNIIKRNIY